MKRAATAIVLCLVALALALAATAQAAAPTVETFVIDRSTGPYAQPAVDGDLVVWVDFRDDQNAGFSGIWGAVIGPHNQTRAFEIAAARLPALQGPRVAGDRVVWFSEEDYETGDPAKVWECIVDKSRSQAGMAQVLGDGTEPDAFRDAVVWTRGAGAVDSTTISVAYYSHKRTPRRIVRAMPGVSSPGDKFAATLSDRLLVWYEEPQDGRGKVMATRPWQTLTPPFAIAEGGFAHRVDGWTVTYGLRNPAYGWFGYDVYAASVDPETLSLRTLRLTDTTTGGWSDVSGGLVVWGEHTRVPSGSGDAIVGAFVDWSAETPVAHEFVVDDAGRYADQPAVAYDAVSGRYLVVWTTQAIGDSSDNKVMGAWITPSAGAASAAN
jgi:hypothetical protein